jgi:hypothetical protein
MTIEEAKAKQAEVVAGHVLYLAEFGDDPVWRLAARVNSLFEDIRALSTLKPTAALVIAGCLDALVAQSEDREIDVDSLVAVYLAANKADYIERNVFGALREFRNILETLDTGLAKLGVPDASRPRWVRAGLDFPDPSDSAAHHINTTVVTRKAGWERAEAQAEAFLAYVEGLPDAYLAGEVDIETVLRSVADGLSGE